MLKVLLVYYEPQQSGQTNHVLSLCHGLDKTKFTITVVLPTKLNQSSAAFKSAGVNVVPLSINKVFWDIQSIISLIRLVRSQNFDIVHVHSQEAGLIARVAARLAGAKAIVYTPQCTNISHAKLFWLYTYTEKLFSYITDMIISVSEKDRMRIIQWGIPAAKVITINNGIDPDLAKEPLDIVVMKQMLGLDEMHPIVMQVCRLSYQKNPLAFVEGASLVIDKFPDVQFILIGDGPLRDEVEESIHNLGLQKKIHCLGWQDDADKLLAIADVVTLTSRWEGMPYVLLEAMAWSRPVVATAVNGCPEIVEDCMTGYLVPTNDPKLWAKSVIDLLEDAKKSKYMGRCGNRRFIEKFSLEKMINQTEELYDRVSLDQYKIQI
jgi:glycosyltransferase involved in cell wall biosynthesis